MRIWLLATAPREVRCTCDRVRRFIKVLLDLHDMTDVRVYYTASIYSCVVKSSPSPLENDSGVFFQRLSLYLYCIYRYRCS